MPLPSLFFIGKNGAPVEIVTGVTKTVDELSSKIDGVLNGVKPKPATSSAAASADLIASKTHHDLKVKDFRMNIRFVVMIKKNLEKNRQK